MKNLFFLFLVGCSYDPPVRLDPVTHSECPDFSNWTEIPSPLKGHRCLSWYRYDDGEKRFSVLCQPIEQFEFVPCADPKADVPLRIEK